MKESMLDHFEPEEQEVPQQASPFSIDTVMEKVRASRIKKGKSTVQDMRLPIDAMVLDAGFLKVKNAEGKTRPCALSDIIDSLKGDKAAALALLEQELETQLKEHVLHPTELRFSLGKTTFILDPRLTSFLVGKGGLLPAELKNTKNGRKLSILEKIAFGCFIHSYATEIYSPESEANLSKIEVLSSSGKSSIKDQEVEQNAPYSQVIEIIKTILEEQPQPPIFAEGAPYLFSDAFKEAFDIARGDTSTIVHYLIEDAERTQSESDKNRIRAAHLQLRAALLTWILFVTNLLFLGSIFSIIPIFAFAIALAISATTLVFALFFREIQLRRTRYAVAIFFTGMQLALVLYAFFPSPLFLFVIFAVTTLFALLVGILLPSHPERRNLRGAIFAIGMVGLIAASSILFRSPAILETISAILEISTPFIGSLKVALFFLFTVLSVLPVLQRQIGKTTNTYKASILLAVIGILSTAVIALLAFVPGLHLAGLTWFTGFAISQKIALVAIPFLLSVLATLEKIVPLLLATHKKNQHTHLQKLGLTPHVPLNASDSPYTLEETIHNMRTALLYKCSALVLPENFELLNQIVKSSGHIRSKDPGKKLLQETPEGRQLLQETPEGRQLLQETPEGRQQGKKPHATSNLNLYEFQLLKTLKPSAAEIKKMTDAQKLAFGLTPFGEVDLESRVEIHHERLKAALEQALPPEKINTQKINTLNLLQKIILYGLIFEGRDALIKGMQALEDEKNRKATDCTIRASMGEDHLTYMERQEAIRVYDLQRSIMSLREHILATTFSQILAQMSEEEHIFEGDKCMFSEAFESAVERILQPQRAYEKGEKYLNMSFGWIHNMGVLLILGLAALIADIPYVFFVIAGASLIVLPISYRYYKRSEAYFLESTSLLRATLIPRREPSSTRGFLARCRKKAGLDANTSLSMPQEEEVKESHETILDEDLEKARLRNPAAAIAHKQSYPPATKPLLPPAPGRPEEDEITYETSCEV